MLDTALVLEEIAKAAVTAMAVLGEVGVQTRIRDLCAGAYPAAHPPAVVNGDCILAICMMARRRHRRGERQRPTPTSSATSCGL